MSDSTAHGLLSGTKTTKVTKITNNYLIFVFFVFFGVLVSERGPSAVSPQAPPTQAQQRPVFRGGTHFVRVDAYPSQDGKIVEGLKPEDFEILEDGKPQAIESFDFVRFDTFTPEELRVEPRTRQEGFDMASDPRARVFVVIVDLPAVDPGAPDPDRLQLRYMERPLTDFLDRIIGPQDLYGFLTSRNTARDLVLARKTAVVKSQIMDMVRVANMEPDSANDALDQCPGGGGAKARHRDDRLYTALETTVELLGSIREERKSIIFVGNWISRERSTIRDLAKGGTEMPKVGITNGRVGIGDRSNTLPASSTRACSAEMQRLTGMDFDARYRELLRDAQRANVSFYPITPAGLQAPTTIAGIDAVKRANDSLISMAHETDGVPIVDTNDLLGGMKRIADDLSAYYVLGYYTTNTKFDGGVRRLSVKAKGKSIRARRQYRAPTEAEIAELSTASAKSAAISSASSSAASVSPREAALTILERASRPFVPYTAAAGKTLTVVAELSAASIQAGRWKGGADVVVEATGAAGEPVASAKGRIEAGSYSVAVPLTITGAWPARVSIALNGPGERPADDWVKLDAPSASLVGEAVASRAGSRIAPRPVAAFEFARNERIRAEWPVLAPLDRREARLLDRSGKPLPVEIPLSEDPAKKTLVVEMSLSGLPRGDYLIELTAGAGVTVERRLLAMRIKP
jgi:VWFA-related protein